MSVHLMVRSAYTLLKSSLRVEDIVNEAVRQGYDAVALSDYEVMHGAMAFYHACQKQGIKGIYGMEVHCVLSPGEQAVFVVLARNDEGFLQLMKLSTRLQTQKEELTIEELAAYAADCIVITSGAEDVLYALLVREDEAGLRRYLQQLQRTFTHLAVGITRNDSRFLAQRNQLLRKAADEMGITRVALAIICYRSAADEEAYRVLCAIDQGLQVDDKTLKTASGRWFRSKAEMAQLYEQKELEASDAIAARCNVEMAFPRAHLPVYENRYGVSSVQFLNTLCKKGLAKRIGSSRVPKAYVQRLQYELEVINSMGFTDYFLIVWDFIRYARSQKIFIGPGRGSAAGSLVSYCLGITHIDPIHYDLLFERFLNPKRVSMPDIDTDFPDDRRQEVIDYVHERYGAHHVAHIITFNTLGAKQVLRDAGKALGILPRQIDALCRMITNMPKVTLQQAMDNVPRFKQTISLSKELTHLYAIASQLEGLPRHASLHAAGIILSREPIESVCPLIRLDEEIFATQYTMEYLEELGLIKMDFLGLRNLTIIDEIVRAIEQKTGRPFDIMKIPLDDERTFQLIRNVDTMGVFQLESEGMKNLIRKIQPRTFEDIAATIALFRPGPMENIPEYLRCRENPALVHYPHPSLEPILNNTYGIMIYQEQVMQVVQVMGGFSLAEADSMRKAISKKKEDELAKYEQMFIQGAIRKGYTQALAQEVYGLIMKFARYGFNRSHSIAYGMIAYQMAYLKANAPLYFYIALLNSVIGAEKKTSEYIFELRRRHIDILLPCVNHSTGRYLAEGSALRFPLSAIKGVGPAVYPQIIAEREENGDYQDPYDFVARASLRKINRKALEALINAGALDTFGYNRATLLGALDNLLLYANIVRVENEEEIRLDFSIASKIPITRLAERSSVRAEKEKEAFGFYLSAHPIAEVRNAIDPSMPYLLKLQHYRGQARFVCLISFTKLHRTKRGDQMMFVDVSDDSAKFDVVVMPNLYARTKDILKKGNMILVEGNIDREGSCLAKGIRLVQPKEEPAGR